VNVGFDVADFGIKGFRGVDAVFKLLALLQYGLSLFLIVPEVGVAGFYFEFRKLFARDIDVKDSSARARCVSGDRRSAVGGLRYVQPFICSL
jgi:hypothetical protein